MIGIYKLTCTKNGELYIGQSKNLEQRRKDYRYPSRLRNRLLEPDFTRYGRDSFTFEVLEECRKEQLDEREKHYISLLKPEYNIQSGGQGKGREVADETKKVLAIKGREQWESYSEERKQYVLQNQLIGPRVGHPVSEGTRQKLREANLGKKQSKETIDKRRISLKEAWKRNPVPHSMKPVICVETGVVFESVKAAAASIGVKPGRITAVLKGKRKRCHGYHFIYAKSVETIPDECKEVGGKMSCPSKCATPKR